LGRKFAFSANKELFRAGKMLCSRTTGHNSAFFHIRFPIHALHLAPYTVAPTLVFGPKARQPVIVPSQGKSLLSSNTLPWEAGLGNMKIFLFIF
jgi:hypothetical protein